MFRDEEDYGIIFVLMILLVFGCFSPIFILPALVLMIVVLWQENKGSRK